jgi:hypothetical protein
MTAAADNLRRRIALYRRYLREGLDGDLGVIYLEEIGKAEAELHRLLGGETTAGSNTSPA